MDEKIGILFVCTGNICRSPMAEGVFRHIVDKEGLGHKFRIESAGTGGYHAGEAPDARAIKTAGKYGVSLEGQKARAVARKDFSDFDYIYAMDGGHFYELHQRAPDGRKARIHMFLSESPGVNSKEVPDPWYGAESDFEHVYRLVEDGARALLKKLKQEHKL